MATSSHDTGLGEFDTHPTRMHLNIYQQYTSLILAFSESTIYGLLIIKK